MSTVTAWLRIVGIGEDGVAGLSIAAKRLVVDAEFLVGGERHLAMVPGAKAEKLVWSSPITATVEQIKSLRGRRVTVLASGDPMFFGIGNTLHRVIPAAETFVVPHPSSFSLAAARLGWPLQDVETVTIHGRPIDKLALYLAPGARLLALSESGRTPNAVARWLTFRGWGDSIVTVLERLGGPEEKISRSPAKDLGVGPWADLNLLGLELCASAAAKPLPRLAGLPDDAFQHDGQLTKREIRAQTLAVLAPLPGELLWDVGAGSGSIGIEWLRASPRGQAIAIERAASRAALITANAASLGVPELKVVRGTAPEAFDGLPAPDAIFVGGGVEPELLEACFEALKPGGRLIANVVTIEGERVLNEFHWRRGGEMTRLAISRAEPLGDHTVWRALMPVTQIIVRKGLA